MRRFRWPRRLALECARTAPLSMTKTQWPKTPAPLTAEQIAAREAFGREWFGRLSSRYAAFERFNNVALSTLPAGRSTWRTLEIGAGLGGHLAFEDLTRQQYHCLEIRPEFCEQLRHNNAIAGVTLGDIQERTPFEDKSFDRIIAIHVLEHLRNLPVAVAEVARLLRDDGILDVVLPCEGGAAYYLARRISTKRMFEKRFGMSYDPIIASEHVSTLDEVLETLRPVFTAGYVKRFPFDVPVNTINLCIALRMHKRTA